MEDNPSLHKRSTKELLNIISNDKKWIKEIQELASEELLKRGFNKEALIKERIKRLEIIERYSEREKNRTQRNRKESYTLFEACLIILFFPFSLFKLGGLAIALNWQKRKHLTPISINNISASPLFW